MARQQTEHKVAIRTVPAWRLAPGGGAPRVKSVVPTAEVRSNSTRFDGSSHVHKRSAPD
jgi:hypothetical protein